jgi:hypothetical protein
MREMNIKHYVCVPAYGRDYETEAEAKQAWESGEDFQIRSIDRMDGKYLDRQEAEHYGLSVQIRYNSQRDVYVWPEPQVDEMNED